MKLLLPLSLLVLFACTKNTPPTGPGPGMCTEEAKVCPDGSAVGRTGPNCEFAECPAVACTEDAFECPDGSAVSRVAPDCEFAPCPDDLSDAGCTEEAFECPDGSYVVREGPDCEFAACP